jgi:hypothetical protein
MTVRQSNLPEHEEFVLKLGKKYTEGMSYAKIVGHTDQVLAPIPHVGLNPYKQVEMFKNYRPNIPVEFHSDELYAEPSKEVWAKVKTEKIDGLEFRAKLKAKKYADNKERIESVAFNDCEQGKA